MVVWHVTTDIMLVIIYLLEDEHELRLGMLIRPKRIYNFCLLHACFVRLCHVLLELLYTFEPIWTNLLTQCTQLPVPVFYCIFFQVFRLFKVPKKFQKNYIKNQRDGTFRKSQEGAGGPPPGTQEGAWRGPPGPRQGASWLPWVAPRLLPSPIFTPRIRNP